MCIAIKDEIIFTLLSAFSHVDFLLFCQLQAVWFGCDVGQHFERKRGALHLDMWVNIFNHRQYYSGVQRYYVFGFGVVKTVFRKQLHSEKYCS